MQQHLSDKWYLPCLFIYVFIAQYFYGHMGDDSFIFFRYIDNFLLGNGLRWNSDELPVEGFSSPLWVGVLILFSRLIDTIFMAKLLGAFFMAISTWRVWQLAKVYGGYPLTSTLGASLGLGVHYWASAGLETGMYVFLFLSSILALNKKASLWWLALLGICRPEGILILPMAYLLYTYKHGFRKRSLFLFLPLLVWLIIRGVYYRDIFPNTYYAKASGPIIDQISSGLDYVRWLLPAAFVGAFFDRKRFLLWSLPLLLMIVVILGGGDWMWHGRLLLPIYMAFWALGTSLNKVLSVVCCLPLCFHWIPMTVFHKALSGQKLPAHSYQEGSLISVSEELASQIKLNVPKGSLIAVNHAGALPYFLMDYFFVDMTGLNDKTIARKEGGLHQKFDSKYILNRKPDVIVLNSFTDPTIAGFVSDYWEGETQLYGQEEFKMQYVPISRCWERIRSGGGTAYICLFQRRKKSL